MEEEEKKEEEFKENLLEVNNLPVNRDLRRQLRRVTSAVRVAGMYRPTTADAGGHRSIEANKSEHAKSATQHASHR